MDSEFLNEEYIENHGGLFVLMGGLMAIIGVLALMMSFATTVLSVIYLGFLLVGAGALEAIRIFKSTDSGGTFAHMLSAVIYVLFGIYLMINPVLGAITMTLVATLFFFAAGVVKLSSSLAVKRFSNKAGWLALVGLLNVLLAILVASQWPVSGLWVIGFFIGLELVFHGVTWMVIGGSSINAGETVSN